MQEEKEEEEEQQQQQEEEEATAWQREKSLKKDAAHMMRCNRKPFRFEEECIHKKQPPSPHPKGPKQKQCLNI